MASAAESYLLPKIHDEGLSTIAGFNLNFISGCLSIL